MNEQQVREIAETAFKRQFGDIGIVRINVRPGLGFEDDSPIVDVNIIYDDESGRVTGRGYNCVRSELVDKAWRESKHLPWPVVRQALESGLRTRWLELAEDDAPWPCEFAEARNVTFLDAREGWPGRRRRRRRRVATQGRARGRDDAARRRHPGSG